MLDPQHLIDALINLGLADSRATLKPRHGGDIHQSYALINSHGVATAFVKANTSAARAVLTSEFESLQLMHEHVPGLYPRPLFLHDLQAPYFLAMSYHALEPVNHSTARDLGALLAAQHKVKHDRFGWPNDNFIGSTQQTNSWCDRWGDFYWAKRMLPQIELAYKNGLDSMLIGALRKLENSVVGQLNELDITPTLLHGDLWTGNAGYDLNNQCALLYDPAPYFGDPEVDLAMTRLFGSFPASFYASYQAVYPQREENVNRQSLYNLYHALNHFNLFGSSYTSMVQRCIDAWQFRR